MINKINSIYKAINSECYLPALALTLTLPDICGQIEYPKEKNVNSRYTKWFDKYVGPSMIDTKSIKFNGELCYKLRCSFLHSGTFDMQKNYNIIFKLHVGNSIATYSSFASLEDNKIIDIDVRTICFFICEAAKNYYNNHSEKQKFNEHESLIIELPELEISFLNKSAIKKA